MEELGFEPFASLDGGADKGEGDGRGKRGEVISNGWATNFSQHGLHSFEEVFDWENLKGASVFKIVNDSVADIGDEGKVVAVACVGSARECFVDPVGGVSGDVLMSDLEGGKVSC